MAAVLLPHSGEVMLCSLESSLCLQVQQVDNLILMCSICWASVFIGEVQMLMCKKPEDISGYVLEAREGNKNNKSRNNIVAKYDLFQAASRQN